MVNDFPGHHTYVNVRCLRCLRCVRCVRCLGCIPRQRHTLENCWLHLISSSVYKAKCLEDRWRGNTYKYTLIHPFTPWTIRESENLVGKPTHALVESAKLDKASNSLFVMTPIPIMEKRTKKYFYFPMMAIRIMLQPFYKCITIFLFFSINQITWCINELYIEYQLNMHQYIAHWDCSVKTWECTTFHWDIILAVKLLACCSHMHIHMENPRSEQNDIAELEDLPH